MAQTPADLLQTHLLHQAHAVLAELCRLDWPANESAAAWGVYGPYRVTVTVGAAVANGPPTAGAQPEPGDTLTKIEKAIQLYLRNPGQSLRDLARRVPCAPSTLARSKELRRLRQAHVRELRRGTKFDGDADAAT